MITETAMETRLPTEEEHAAMVADWQLARMRPRGPEPVSPGLRRIVLACALLTALCVGYLMGV